MKVLFLSSGRRTKEIEDALKNNNISVITLLTKKWNLFLCALLAAYKKYDIIHADDALLNGAIACLIAKLRGKKATCLIRGYGAHIQKQKRYRLFKRLLFYLAEKISFRYMNHIFFISADTENKIKNNFSVYANTSIAPNGINIPKKYTKKDLKEFLRKQTGKNIDKNDLILITVTNLKFSEKAEGIEILKKTMNQLPKNIWLIILGDGRFLNKVMDNCSNNIIFAGYQKKVYDWLSGSDIFVYCSFLDSLGQVMLEAQAVGLPVVASKIGGISETTKHGSLCKPSPEDFTKALKPLIASKNLRKKQGEQNKCWIKKRSWKNTTKKYITVWNKLSTK